MSPSMQPDITELHKAYSRGENIIQLLTNKHPNLTRTEIIEISYDIQSGSHIKALENPRLLQDYANEIHEISGHYIAE
jgi:hypothetical protein